MYGSSKGGKQNTRHTPNENIILLQSIRGHRKKRETEKMDLANNARVNLVNRNDSADVFYSQLKITCSIC